MKKYEKHIAYFSMEIAIDQCLKSYSGGLGFLAGYADAMFDPGANEDAAEFVRDKIRDIVNDPETAELLCPSNTIGCKRLCVDTNYYATYNKPNVHLVDVSKNPVERIDQTSIHTGGKAYEVDAIVFAIGFDAMTGALLRVDIRGRDGRSLRDEWKDGPRTYMGLSMAGLPASLVMGVSMSTKLCLACFCVSSRIRRCISS